MSGGPTRPVVRALLGLGAALALAGGGTTLWISTAAVDPLAHRAYAPEIAADSASSTTATPSPTTTTPGASSSATSATPSATPTSTASPTPTLTPTQPPPRYLAVTVTQGDKSATVTAELALTPAQWQQGLMGRTYLADDQGMLFVFPSQRTTGFWMAGTPIPLDIAFINSTGQVIDILHGQPYDLTPLVPSEPYLYVLEVRGGWFADMGMGIGAQIEGLEGLP